MQAALLLLATMLIASPALSADAPKSNEEKAFYSIGTSYAQQLSSLSPVGDRELDMLILGLRDALSGNTLAVDQQTGAGLVRSMVQARQAKALAAEKAAAAEFLKSEAAKKGAETTESGLIYTVIKEGEGRSPTATQKVRVHYHGTLRDGTVFDSSVDRNEPAEFPLNRVIACWTEGVAKMKIGGKSRLICPSDIAYGERATGRIPAGAVLNFEVELLGILD